MADIATDEAKTGATYGDLTTVGPAVTKTLVNGQKCIVQVGARTLTSTDGNSGYMSFSTATLAANDANGAHVFITKTLGSAANSVWRSSVYTATAGASTTFTAKYKSDGTGNLHFIERRIIVKPY